MQKLFFYSVFYTIFFFEEFFSWRNLFHSFKKKLLVKKTFWSELVFPFFAAFFSADIFLPNLFSRYIFWANNIFGDLFLWVMLAPAALLVPSPHLPGREGGLANERPWTDHVIWGTMRGNIQSDIATFLKESVYRPILWNSQNKIAKNVVCQKNVPGK